MHFPIVEIILYVADQTRSRNFYAAVLDQQPDLDVPGMTEFLLNPACKLGLMPETSIAKILEGKTPHPADGNGIPRCELYLYTQNPTEACDRALKAGAKLVSPVSARDWGDSVGYVADFDGHILAFATKTQVSA